MTERAGDIGPALREIAAAGFGAIVGSKNGMRLVAEFVLGRAAGCLGNQNWESTNDRG